MFVKNTLKEEVSIVVELGGAVRRNFDPAVDVKNMNLQDSHAFFLFLFCFLNGQLTVLTGETDIPA